MFGINGNNGSNDSSSDGASIAPDLPMAGAATAPDPAFTLPPDEPPTTAPPMFPQTPSEPEHHAGPAHHPNAGLTPPPPAPPPPLPPLPPPPPPPPISYPSGGADQPDGSLISLKQQALQNLAPLVSKLEQTPEEKFKTTMMMLQASDNPDLVKDAYAAANQITDEKVRAQALLDVVNEINYFTQSAANGQKAS